MEKEIVWKQPQKTHAHPEKTKGKGDRKRNRENECVQRNKGGGVIAHVEMPILGDRSVSALSVRGETQEDALL